MADTLVAPAPAEELNSITQKSVMLILSYGKMGDEKQVPRSKIAKKKDGDEEPDANPEITVEVQADPSWMRATKKLFKSTELAAIRTFDGQTKDWVEDKCLPGPWKGKGIYLIGDQAVEPTVEYLEKRQAERLPLVDAFISKYGAIIEEAKAALGPDFNSSDYPSENQARSQFYFNFNVITFVTPEKLKTIAPSVFAKEKAKAEKQWHEATEEVRLALRAGLKEMVDHMLERLTPDEDGKAKKFMPSSIKKIHEFLESFDLKNITDDQELKALVDSAKKILKGETSESIRKNEAVRDNLQKVFGIMAGALEVMTVEAGARKVQFAEEEEASAEDLI